MTPEFIIFTGPMFGGKTTKMLAMLERAKYQNKNIILFKPIKDDRYSTNKVVTHSGISWDSQDVVDGYDIIKNSDGYDIISVDEAFMIPGVSDALIKLFKQGKTIYVSSIQLSAKGKPFEEIVNLFPWATKIEVCPAVCPVTGEDAYYTISKETTEDIQVGGEKLYEPRSFFVSNIFEKHNN
jgi:thymidine kinase